MQAVVLAGGLATRLGARARDVPKYLLPICGQPFARHQLRLIADSGFDDVVICIGHLGDPIVEALGDRCCGMRIRYARDAEQGTAGALWNARAMLDDAFVLTYGDSYLPFDYASPLRDLTSSGTMALFRNDGAWDTSNVKRDGDRVIQFGGDGCDHIDYGATALRREALRDVRDLSALFADLVRRRELRAVDAPERFYEIGSPQGIADLEAYLG